MSRVGAVLLSGCFSEPAGSSSGADDEGGSGSATGSGTGTGTGSSGSTHGSGGTQHGATGDSTGALPQGCLLCLGDADGEACADVRADCEAQPIGLCRKSLDFFDKCREMELEPEELVSCSNDRVCGPVLVDATYWTAYATCLNTACGPACGQFATC